MMKFFQKMSKDAFKLQFAAFLWILICNILVQILHEPLESIGVPGWTIFLANVLFFIKNNPNHKEGLLENACGGIFGLICAVGLVYMDGWLVGLGLSPVMAIIIPIAIFLFLTIAIHPLVPYVFNNMALCFFMVALIEMTVVENLWGHILGVILGNVIVNVGTILVIDLVLKWSAKK
ncbi:MAG: hypothetical protein IJ106_12655 [Parasporobacterium sp.]|nr:hypothetical protein [Parasporobacterium sp.]